MATIRFTDTSLWEVPTSQLLSELRRREREEFYSVERLEPPASGMPLKWGVYQDGAIRDTPHGPSKAYTAICPTEATAVEIAECLATRSAARLRAHKE